MKRIPFNMIEVTLALLVISIGVISIFGLVPIGFKAHRDSISHNYSADAAEDLLNYISDRLQQDWDTEKAKYGSQPVDISNTANFPRDISSGWTSLGNNRYKSTSSDAVYRIMVTSKVRHSGGKYRDVTDFDGVIRLWKTPTAAHSYSGGTWTTPQIDSSYQRRLLLHAEISWPATNPYGDRSKAHYVMEVLRQP